MNLLVTLTVLAALSVNVVWSRRQNKQRAVACLSGDGSDYRGHVSVSVNGYKCLRWNSFRHFWGASEGVGTHNYCRNPDQSLMPWCRVRKGGKYVKEFCNIPTCPADTELTCGEMSQQRMHKIVGGSFARIESHPWVAAIFNRNNFFFCGGSLIAPCWVLTAAHCISDVDEAAVKHLSVYLGKAAINETDVNREQRFSVEKVIMHQNFNEITFDNDIALLKIKNKDGGCAVKSSTARTVCLPPPQTQLPAGFQCNVAGYGKERSDGWHYSQYLKRAKVNLLHQDQCKSESYYGDLITNNMICAASPDWSSDACKGDSGGPLVCEMSGRIFQFGVVSWGEGCALENKPGVYTQVSNYNKWIADKTGLPQYTRGAMYPIK